MNPEMEDLSDNYDMISSMPDSILIHILTFLKAKEAVQTCLLSKRWIDLWAYLPSLKFDSEEFENDMTILAKELPNCSTFKNLSHLILDVCLKSGSMDVMDYFLQCSPNLDNFYFSNLMEYRIAEDEYPTDNEDEDVYGDND